MWESGSFPDTWKNRWIVPIPKKPDPDITDLRPLMLMEALRKVWGTVFVRRIQRMWKNAGALCPNQFGCVPGKGTDGAVAEFLNAAETAKERRTPVYMTSWDIRRAFDSVAKPLVSISLRRLGIPDKVVEYIRNVDDGISAVRTPWALHCTETGEEILGFQGERGIGQGDVISPLIWTALFDILLTALSKVRGGIITCTRHGYVAESQDVAFADDLVSVQGDLQSLQEKADLVSAFCVWSGLTLAVDKFRAFAINWGNENIDMGTDIVIHTKGWVPMTVPLKTNGSLKHLGVTWDMELGNDTQRNQLENYLSEALAYIVARRASTQCKILAITKCVIPKILYVCKFMGWTLAQYDHLESLISRALRQILKLPHSFPSELLYISKSESGMGFDSLVDITHRAKHRMYQRLLDDQFSSPVASSMLARAFRARGQVLQPYIQSTLQEAPWLSNVWATSLVEWMERNDIRLMATGRREETEGTSEHIPQALQTGLYTAAESTGMGAVKLRVGQFWMNEEERDLGNAIELVTVNHLNVMCMKWRSSDGQRIESGSKLLASPATHGEGPGPDGLEGSPEELVAGLTDTHYLLSVTGDRHTCEGAQAVNECTVLKVLPRMATVPEQPISVQWPKCGSDVTLYTDGTYNVEGTLLEQAQGGVTVRAAAAVVATDVNGDTAWRIDKGVQMRSAYEAEVVALAIARVMADGATIVSDCQAAISAAGETQHRAGIAQLLSMAPSSGEIRKVKAHAERRGEQQEWTTDEAGNVKADRVAAGIGYDGVALRGLDIMEAVIATTPLVWTNQKGEVVLDPKSTTRLSRYAKARDQYRAQAADARPPRWEGTTAKLASSMWTTQECSWALSVKIVWDKHLTGQNEAKWGRPQPGRCPVCGAVTSQKHMIVECQRPGMQAIRASAIKKFQAETTTHGNTLVGRSLQAIGDLLAHDDAYTIWTGMWTPEIRAEIARRCPWQLKKKEYGLVVKAMRHLANGTLAMHRVERPIVCRKRARDDAEQVQRQASIDEGWIKADRERQHEQLGVHRQQEKGSEAESRECDEMDGRDFDKRQYDG